MDKYIFFKLYNISKKNKYVYTFFIFINNVITKLYFLIYTSFVIILYIQKSNFLVPFILAPCFALVCNYIIRIIFKRKRPCTKKSIEKSSYSFPSNHSVSAMVISVSCLYINIYIGIILIILAIFIGISRIFIGVHYPSDIIVGFLNAILSSILFFNIF